MNYWVQIRSAFHCMNSDRLLSVEVGEIGITFIVKDGSGRREVIVDIDEFEEFIVQALRDTKTLKKG